MAERVKMSIGSAYPLPEEMTVMLRGRNLVTGLPEAIEVSSVEIREALSGSVNIIVDLIKDTLDDTPPELIADLMDTGICLAGGSSQLKGLDERVSDETNMNAWVADDSMTCVARGAGKVLEELDTLRDVLSSTDVPVLPTSNFRCVCSPLWAGPRPCVFRTARERHGKQVCCFAKRIDKFLSISSP
jgi:rod shape-determining protein MreB